jgi:hypothetical protein
LAAVLFERRFSAHLVYDGYLAWVCNRMLVVLEGQ